jgi:hypothetical protein
LREKAEVHQKLILANREKGLGVKKGHFWTNVINVQPLPYDRTEAENCDSTAATDVGYRSQKGHFPLLLFLILKRTSI